MTKPLSEVVQNIKPSGIRKFFDIVSEMKDAISLGVGEPDFDTPWHIRDEGIFALEKGKTFYTSNSGLKELREEIWISCFLFILVLIRDYIYNHEKISSKKESLKKKEYIISKYYKYKKKYDKLVKVKNIDISNLIYAIMIYENYNRPPIIREIEKIKLLISGHATLGIMQVSVTKLINNEESIKLGVNKILKEIKKEKKEKNFSISNIIQNYNNGEKYKAEVMYIYEIIRKENGYNDQDNE